MNKDKLETYREKLTDLDQLLRQRLAVAEQEDLHPGGARSSGGESNMPTHLGDHGTDQIDQDLTLGMLETVSETLEEVDAALLRIQEGTYGKCENCGARIAESRLNVLPYARYCVDCASRIQEKTPVI
jgi:RNA polymerase-binding transcription factor DksA